MLFAYYSWHSWFELYKWIRYMISFGQIMRSPFPITPPLTMHSTIGVIMMTSKGTLSYALLITLPRRLYFFFCGGFVEEWSSCGPGVKNQTHCQPDDHQWDQGTFLGWFCSYSTHTLQVRMQGRFYLFKILKYFSKVYNVEIIEVFLDQKSQ